MRLLRVKRGALLNELDLASEESASGFIESPGHARRAITYCANLRGRIGDARAGLAGLDPKNEFPDADRRGFRGVHFAPARILSSCMTGTLSKRPILIVGISPR